MQNLDTKCLFGYQKHFVSRFCIYRFHFLQFRPINRFIRFNQFICLYLRTQKQRGGRA